MYSEQLIQFQDRHNTNYLLGPTHEEEITQLVASTVYSHKQLPLRLYQISMIHTPNKEYCLVVQLMFLAARKFRDERRPRAGLLRGREFLMKDLYTFDNGTHGALSTYEAVKSSYKSIFDTLGLPYLVSEADSGAMGGNLSHEYHYPCSTGEDTVLHCADTDGCGYTANMECVGSVPAKPFGMIAWKDKRVWYGVSKDRKVLIRAIYPGHVRQIGKDGEKEEWIKREVNPSEVQKIIGEDGGGLDIGMEEATALNLWGQHFTPWADALDHTTGQALRQYSRVIKLYDQHLIDGDGVAKRTTFSDHEEDFDALSSSVIQSIYTSKKIPTIVQTSSQNSSGDEVRLSLLRPTTGDTCPKCKTADLTATTTTELGHTFFLGTRYSEPLQARSHSTDAEGNQQLLPIQMGCYGIGVSRLIAAIAEVMRDDKGLCWPKVIAPYSVAIIGVSPNEEMRAAIEGVYDDVIEGCCEGEKRFLDEEDVIMDDRLEKFGFKISEADAIGYSVVVVVGRKFEDGFVELQERRTGEKVEVSRGELIDKLRAILR